MEKRSWITPTFNEVQVNGTVGCVVSLDALGIVEFLATRKRIELIPTRASNQVRPRTIGSLRQHARTIASLGDELGGAVLDAFAAGLLGKIPANAAYVYLHGVYELPDIGKLCVLFRLEKGMPSANCLDVLGKAAELWSAYLARQKTWEDERATEKRRNDELRQDVRQIVEKMAPYYGKPPPAVPTAKDLQGSFRRAVWAQGRQEVSEKRLIEALEESAIPPAGDGNYELLRFRSAENQRVGLVTWVPRGSLPTVLEMKAAAERAVPRAFVSPRSAGINPPDFYDALEPTPLDGSAVASDLLRQQLEDLQIELPRDDIEARANRGRGQIRARGFEAVGWYQSFHYYDDASWGIYLHADRLLDMACGLATDLGAFSKRPLHLGIHLAVGQVICHELFHVQIEACSTYVELQTLRGRYRRYHNKVYKHLQFKDDWLEEALANYVAFKWAAGQHAYIGESLQLIKDERAFQHVLKVLESWLDFSPKGYSAWRDGFDFIAWRTLARQIATGNPNGEVRGRPLPIEGSLQGPLPFEPLDQHIPIRVVGSGLLADTLFSAPSRSEAQRALKYFGYQLIESRGKGSHEFWQGADGRGFPLPRRDPLSVGVFTSLLHHFNLTKRDYMQRIRPAL